MPIPPLKRLLYPAGALLVCWLAMTAPATADSLTDQLGRSVFVPASPRRIVSLAPSITEILYALEQQHRLVGVTRYSDYPATARRLPRVGSYIHLDIEAIVALQPDLCIAVKDGNPVHTIHRLESLGIAVYATDPRNLDSVLATLEELGGVLAAEAAARRLTTRMQHRIERVKKRVRSVHRRPRVFFQIGIQPIVSAGSGTFIDHLITTAGGRNLADGDIPYPRFSEEEVVALAPEVIVMTSMARDRAFLAMQSRWQRWQQMPAAAHKRIHTVNSDIFDRPSPRLVDGLEQLAGLLHPEVP